jgi:hypothetical protein
MYNKKNQLIIYNNPKKINKLEILIKKYNKFYNISDIIFKKIIINFISPNLMTKN